jgi:HSP20 family molecular chaperone IbpA
MSTRLLFNGESIHPFDVLFKDLFKDSETFVPAYGTKSPHPLDIYETKDGLVFEVACTGIEKEAVKISTEDRDVLKITYEKPKETENVELTYIHKGIAKRSFNLAYKIASKYDLESCTAKMDNGLLKIVIPYAEESKPRTLKIE